MSGGPTRRAMLRLLAVAPGLVPLLEARRARARAAAPRRLVIVQWTNGVLPELWPALPAAGQPFAFTPTLAPLEPHRQDITLIGGLTIDHPLRTGHHSLPVLLTGRAADGPKGYPVANSISVDQYVADRLSAAGPRPIRSLELGVSLVNNEELFRSVSYRGPAVNGRPSDNPPEINPYRVWQRFFQAGAVPGGGAGALGDRLAGIIAERRSVLDYLAGDLGVLSTGVSRADRRKLEAHLASVRQLEKELPGPAGFGPPPAACMPQPPPAGLAYRDHLQIDKQVAVQMDLLVLALRCDLTRVVTLMLADAANNGVGFPFLGPEFQGSPLPESAFDHHGIAHKGGPKKARVDVWWMEQFAGLLARMKSVPEEKADGSPGTLLDSCAVLIANHMGNGSTHKVAGLPFILAGSCGGYFAPGRYVTVPGWNPATPLLGCVPHNRVLVALANAMLDGAAPPLDGFGDPSKGGELVSLRG